MKCEVQTAQQLAISSAWNVMLSFPIRCVRYLTKRAGSSYASHSFLAAIICSVMLL